jgi:hypothetical protein
MFRQYLAPMSVVVCLAASHSAGAQTAADDYSTPAHVSAAQGRATIERNGRAEAATENLPLLVGDRLRTDVGRLEVLLPDGSALALDGNSMIDLLAGGLMRLFGGRMVLVVSSPADGEPRRDYQVDARAGMVRFLTSGEYRVSVVETAGATGVEVAVVRGRAVIDAEGSSVRLSAGERATAVEGHGVASPRTFNSALADAFYIWADQLRSERVGSQSNAYLPSELQVYGGTFDHEGSWDSVPDYGYVWYPRVAADWRPYYDGAWQSYGWGWTWVGAGRWAWPTHHYGRWGYGTRGWFWIPTAAWGPGWVSWGIATDYVAWCPLGWNGGPVFGLSFGYATGWHSDPWRGWTVAPQHAFGRGGGVPSYALRGDHLRTVDASQFAVRRTAPAAPGVAANRETMQPFGSSNGRGRVVASARGFADQGRTVGGTATARPERPSVAQRPWSGDASTPYAAAQAAAATRLRADQGRTADAAGGLSARPGVAQRSWGVESSSPYGSAQAIASERLRRLEPSPSAAPRRDDTQPFTSPSPTSSAYPDRFRAAVGSGRGEPGPTAVPRSDTYRIYGAGPSAPYRSQPSSDPRSYAAPAGSGAGLPSQRSYDAPGANGARRSAPPANVGRGSSPGGLPANVGRGGPPGGSPSRASSSGGRSSGGPPSRGGGDSSGGRRR